MDFQRQTNKRLYEEHVATLQLLSRVERGVYRPRRRIPRPGGRARSGPRSRAPCSRLSKSRSRDTLNSNAICSRAWRRRGDGDLAALLKEEHVTIRAVAQSIVALLRRSLAGELQPHSG